MALELRKADTGGSEERVEAGLRMWRAGIECVWVSVCRDTVSGVTRSTKPLLW
jgi:hypothetical protein